MFHLCDGDLHSEGGRVALLDGWACTAPGTCKGNVCTTPLPGNGALVYFEDSFATQKGWAFPNNDWAIGPTIESVGVSVETPKNSGNFVPLGDPAYDHTLTFDNRVAGVLLGLNASVGTVKDFLWLESPPVDVSHAPTLTLEFWRWLTSFESPTMVNRIEVFDGKNWMMLWESTDAISDREWTLQSFDISDYKNAQLQVRFGYKVPTASVGSIGQWNIDDVRIATAPCGGS